MNIMFSEDHNNNLNVHRISTPVNDFLSHVIKTSNYLCANGISDGGMAEYCGFPHQRTYPTERIKFKIGTLC